VADDEGRARQEPRKLEPAEESARGPELDAGARLREFELVGPRRHYDLVAPAPQPAGRSARIAPALSGVAPAPAAAGQGLGPLAAPAPWASAISRRASSA